MSATVTYLASDQVFDIASGVDILAPAFGNVHGEYGPRGIILEYERLDEIRRVTSKVGVFIALHGVNKFPMALTQRLIAAGVTKVNLNRDIPAVYYEHLEKRINKVPFTQLLEECADIIADSMAEYMNIVLSSGRA